ncbi:hypothetical protein LCGC14_1478780 [marine sediment metagenome]|uniref:Uncharacterized protein n=1 Tax=marine sediment metagenome TaxID=412755 RepID=A0A0F9JW32_9ZZZZ
MQALEHQHPELQHHVHRRTPALGAAWPARRLLQDRSEARELHRPVQRLQRITPAEISSS